MKGWHWCLLGCLVFLLGVPLSAFSGDAGVLNIPVAVPVKSRVAASPEEESLYRRLVDLFGHAQNFEEGSQHDLPIFSDFAIGAPGLFFSDDHEATSQTLIASEFTRLLANGEPERVWSQCLALRWTAAHFDLFAPVCNTARQKVDRNASVKGGGAVAAITISAKPETAAALDDYLDNPYDAERLRRLIALIRGGRPEDLGRLLKEMTQLDDQYLWNRTKGSKSLGDWTLFGIEKTMPDLPPQDPS